jgi:hypothetical protein
VARSEDSECEQADQEVARVPIAEQRVAGLLEIDSVGDAPPLGGGPIDCLWIGAVRLTARDEIREPLTASSRSTSSLPTCMTKGGSPWRSA